MPSLYRKWRSRSFDDLVGQDPVVRTLRNAVRQQRVAHAYLFTGPRGTGKTSAARILAKAINCLHPIDGNPCNECEACLASNEGRAIDVIEIDAASNTSVEHVRDLRERVAYAAGEGQFKVYIVDEVHRLSGAAFDAFLKTLEEPPPHVVFVFASTEPHKVPETIASRCQRFDFRRIAAPTVLDRVRFVAEQESILAEHMALTLIAQQAHGSLRDALGLLEQVASYVEGEVREADVREALGLADAGLVSRLTDNMLEGQVGRALTEIAQFVSAGGDVNLLTRQLIEYWQTLLAVTTGSQISQAELDPSLAADAQRHAQSLSHVQVVAVLRSLTTLNTAPRSIVPSELPLELNMVQATLALQQGSRMTSTLRPVPEAPETSNAVPTPQSSPVPVVEEGGVEAAKDLPPHPTVPMPVAPQPASDAETRAESRNVWPAIVERMGLRSKSLQAILRDGIVVRHQTDELTIGFGFKFHYDMFADTQKKRMLEQVVQEVMGANIRVKPVKVSPEQIRASRGENPDGDDDAFITEAAERLRSFHAHQIRNGGT